eukprot:scaffold900_cov399-Pavlova_lutheri.AAC.8
MSTGNKPLLRSRDRSYFRFLSIKHKQGVLPMQAAKKRSNFEDSIELTSIEKGAKAYVQGFKPD